MNEMKIVLVGIGGYGDNYVRALTENPCRENLKIEGVVDPYAKSASGYEALKALNVPMYDSLDEFYAEHSADLAIISTPITFHTEQAVCAITHGSNVLLEKPIAATISEARKIIDARDKYNVKVAIGFQWCYDKTMLEFKRDADAGKFGKPLSMKALVLWPRDKAYYARGSGWAGKKYDAKGRAIFDSVASNATAHYLENLLWLAGSGMDGAKPIKVDGETYKSNKIENYDTVTMRMELENGVKGYYAASHAIEPNHNQEPTFEYRFENAVAKYGTVGTMGEEIVIEYNNGEVFNYGKTDRGGIDKLWTIIDAIRNNAEIPCTADTAMIHAIAMEKLREVSPDAKVFSNIVDTPERTYVKDLDKALIKCYEDTSLLSETDFAI